MKNVLCAGMFVVAGLFFQVSVVYPFALCGGYSSAKRVKTIFFNNQADLTEYELLLRDFIKDDACSGVILEINNSGGRYASFCVIHDLVKKCAERKPVVALITANAYSAGYLVASAADYIFAHSCSGIGSIGIYVNVDRYADLHVDQDGKSGALISEMVCAGKYTELGLACAQDLTDEQRDFLQAYAELLYSEFVRHVANNRGLDIAKSSIWADAKEFYTPQALEVGLIDAIGTRFDAEAKMCELLNVSRSKVVFE